MKRAWFLLVFAAALIFACGSPDNGDPASGGDPEDPVVGDVLTPGTPRADSVELGGTNDYTFAIADPAYYSITLSGITSGGSLSMFLYSNAERTSLIDTGLFNTNIKPQILEAGMYYLRVSNTTTSVSTPISYTVTVSRTGDLPYEGTLAQPVQLELAAAHSSRASSIKDSYYSFTIQEDGFYSVSLADFDSGSVNLQLFDNAAYDGVNLYQAYDTTTGITQMELRAGTYYLLADGYSTGNHTFSMTVARDGDFPSEGLQSAPAPLTVDVAHAARVSAKNPSWYRVDIPSGGGTCSIVLADMSAGDYVDLYLYSDSAYSKQLAYSTSTATGLGSVGLTAGAWYIKVTTSSTFPTFTMTVDRTGDFTADGSVANPVALTMGAANSVKVGSITGATTSYYTLEVTQSGLHSLAASGLSSYLYFRIYSDAGYTTLLNELSNASGFPSYEMTAGTWYIAVSNSGGADRSFTLTPARDGDFTRDGTKTNPAEVQVGVPFSGKVGYSTQFDYKTSYYRVNVPSSGVYNFALSNLSSGNVLIQYYTSPSYGSGNYGQMYQTTTGGYLALDHAGDWYFYINNLSSTYNLKTYTLTITRTGDYLVEGTETAPLEIALDTARDGRIGYAVNQLYSYYTFTAAQDGKYNIATTGLGTNCTFGVYLKGTDPYYGYKAENTSAGMIGYSLKAGTWVLKMNRSGTVVPSSDATYSLTVSRVGDYGGEGTKTAPVVLTPGTPRVCKVGAYKKGADISYYSIPITEDGKYSFTSSGTLPSSYSLRLKGGPSGDDMGFSLADISGNTYTAGTTLTLEFSSNDSNADRSFTLTCARTGP